MNFAIRREVILPGYEERFADLSGIPIELALPYKLETFLPVQELLPSCAAFARDQGVIVKSVHATQGHLTDPNFHAWSLATATFAESVGAKYIVFHPEESRQDMRVNKQIIAMRNIRRLQRETTVTVCIESFGSKKRIFRPEEICLEELPMCLDTSHLFIDRTMELIDKCYKNIAYLHLSEARDGNQHMPVHGYAFEILDKLQSMGWNGLVVLEYLYEYHDRLIPDMQTLHKRYGG